VKRTLPPSAEIEKQIDQLLAVGVGENPRESLSELAKLGARLIIQRAVEDEFDAWLGRARYELRPDYQRGLRSFDSGLRNGYRPRRVQASRRRPGAPAQPGQHYDRHQQREGQGSPWAIIWNGSTLTRPCAAM
jgi:hypothetical protein